MCGSYSLKLMADQNKRRNLVERSRLAEEAERWDDMVGFMKTLVQQGRDLSVDERNLFANAYKNYVGSKRLSWRVVASIEQQIDISNRKRDLSREYKLKIEEELKAVCQEVLQLIETFLIITIDIENKIFYMKMNGDYYRYLSEFAADSAGDHVFESAKMAYAQAYELARENLTPAHPLRLGLVLNFSVFHYEIFESHEMACEMARECLELGEEDLNNLRDVSKNDSALIMQLLKDNLRLWTSEMENQAASRGFSARF